MRNKIPKKWEYNMFSRYALYFRLFFITFFPCFRVKRAQTMAQSWRTGNSLETTGNISFDQKGGR